MIESATLGSGSLQPRRRRYLLCRCFEGPGSSTRNPPSTPIRATAEDHKQAHDHHGNNDVTPTFERQALRHQPCSPTMHASFADTTTSIPTNASVRLVEITAPRDRSSAIDRHLCTLPLRCWTSTSASKTERPSSISTKNAGGSLQLSRRHH